MCWPTRVFREAVAGFSMTFASSGRWSVIACAAALAAAAAVSSGAAAGRAPAQIDPAAGDVGRALTALDRDAVVARAQRYVRIPSEYSAGQVADHARIALALAEDLRELGLEVHVLEPDTDFPVVVGRLHGTRGTPVLGAMGHYNTVPVGDRAKWSVDPLAADILGGRLYGRGTLDQKGGIAALVEATAALVRAAVARGGDLVLLFIPGEGAQEHVLPKVTLTHRDLLKTDWYLDTDGDADIVAVAAGHVWLRLTSRGRAAHPGGDVPWVNASAKLVKVAAAIQEFDAWMTYEKHPLLTGLGGRPRVEVTVLKAGTAVNQIPELAEAEVDVRLNPRQTPERVIQEMEALIAKMRQADPDIDVGISRIGTQHVPYEQFARITPDDPLVRTIRDVSRRRLGREPGFVGSRAGGRPDLWRMGSMWISWGVNEGANRHAPDEWLDVAALRRSAEAYTEILVRMLR